MTRPQVSGDAMRVEVVESAPASAQVIRNLYPLYLHDLSEFSGEVPNAHGVYEPQASVRTLAEQGSLPYQNLWWEKPGVLHPLLIRANDMPAGFALVCAPPYAPPDVQFCMQEFFVVRSLRRKGVGSRAAGDVFKRLRGRWQVAALHRNQNAAAFWRRLIDRCTTGRFTEAPAPATPAGAMRVWRFDNSAHFP